MSLGKPLPIWVVGMECWKESERPALPGVPTWTPRAFREQTLPFSLGRSYPRSAGFRQLAEPERFPDSAALWWDVHEIAKWTSDFTGIRLSSLLVA